MNKKQIKKLYNEIWSFPAPAVPTLIDNKNFLDDLHTFTELYQANLAGLLENYLKSGKKKWDNELLEDIKKDLSRAYKAGQKSKDKETFKQLKINMNKILKIVKLMHQIK